MQIPLSALNMVELVMVELVKRGGRATREHSQPLMCPVLSGVNLTKVGSGNVEVAHFRRQAPTMHARQSGLGPTLPVLSLASFSRPVSASRTHPVGSFAPMVKVAPVGFARVKFVWVSFAPARFASVRSASMSLVWVRFVS